MIAPRIFVEAEGMVHLVSPITGGEQTICGDAFDLGSDEHGYEWSETASRTVTCRRCALVIHNCRGVRTAVEKGEAN